MPSPHFTVKQEHIAFALDSVSSFNLADSGEREVASQVIGRLYESIRTTRREYLLQMIDVDRDAAAIEDAEIAETVIGAIQVAFKDQILTEINSVGAW